MLSRQSITLADQAPEHEKCLMLYQEVIFEQGAGITSHYLSISPEWVNMDLALPDKIQNYMDMKPCVQHNLDQRLNAIEAKFYKQFDKEVIEIKEREELSVPEENVLMRPSVFSDERCEVGIKKNTSGLITSQLKNAKLSKSHSPIQRSGFNATVVSVVPVSQIIRDSEELQSLLAKSKQSDQHSDRNPMATITESSQEYQRAIKNTTTELELLDQRRSKLKITKHDEGYFAQFKNAPVEEPALKKPRLKSPLTKIHSKGKSPDAFQTNVIKVNLAQKSKNWEVAVIEKSPVQKKPKLKNVKLAEHFKSLITEQSQSMSSFHKDYRPFQDKSYFTLIERLPKHKQTQSTADLYIPKHEKFNDHCQAPKKDPQQFLHTIQADQQLSQYQAECEQEVIKTHHAPNVHLEDAPINPDTKRQYTRMEELAQVQQFYRNSINSTKPKEFNRKEQEKEETPTPYYLQQVQQYPQQSNQAQKQLPGNPLNRLNNNSDSDEENPPIRSSLHENQKRLQELENNRLQRDKFQQEQKNKDTSDKEREARIEQLRKDKEEKKLQAKNEKAAKKELAQQQARQQARRDAEAQQESKRQERLKKSREVNEQLSYQYIKDMDREVFSFNPNDLNARDIQNIKIPNKDANNTKAPAKINIDLRNFMIKPEEPPHRISYSPPGMQRFERPGQKDMFINVKIQ